VQIKQQLIDWLSSV